MNSRTSAHHGLDVEAPGPGVVHLRLNWPERRNALSGELATALVGMLEELAEDEAVRAVVLSGHGGTFSSGGDLDSIAEYPTWSEAALEQRFRYRFAAAELLHIMPKPTVAVIEGAAVGAGLGLALACDIRLASPDARFRAPFSLMGLVPDYGASWSLPRAVGQAAAMEMALSARWVAADEAQRLGLVLRVTTEPLTAALELARACTSRPTFGVAETKRLFHASAGREFADGLADECAVQARAFQQDECRSRIDEYRKTVGA
jgi:2-(1,2-epoxy-1,2-dihydrophenyl)acetyl-CoA isomerase